ncbi:flagellar export protein FliJ [Clostridium sp. MT-14]|mgnify:CR=1 FL=1|uniref:Flagellar FliJ protein n=1 Tax=Clostridium aromativorans TaxID=2836848 RepID=A0ABS8N2F4_9CLOT|nr:MULTISPECIES: flagellar export protein FliJ [Clostridium]KAA8675187.1 flagellar export protein FliJ [Clostridium sp. HV4-5-A1G]MCC9293979.1 flagellar export protein FliJ [Clostridium aromativorans]CAB1242016.1 Flagellar protein fliJ [Clostridiaceae bacterium BL-3]
MKYNFKLQKLLDMRIDREDKSKIEFQKAQSEKLKVKEKLTQMEEKYNEYKNRPLPTSAIEQKITHIYINALDYNINETSQELSKKEKIVEGKREELKQRQIDRKTVETLKDKGYRNFVKEQNRIEQKLNDEFALYGFIRNLGTR